MAARNFIITPFGMCATGITIAILNDLKSQSAAAPMTRFVLNLELRLVVKDIRKLFKETLSPTDFSKWRELAADRGQWRAICGAKSKEQQLHRNEPTKHLDKTTEWKWPLLRNLHTVSPTD